MPLPSPCGFYASWSFQLSWGAQAFPRSCSKGPSSLLFPQPQLSSMLSSGGVSLLPAGRFPFLAFRSLFGSRDNLRGLSPNWFLPSSWMRWLMMYSLEVVFPFREFWMVVHMLSSNFLHTSLAFGHMALGFWAYLSGGCLAGSVLGVLLSCCGRICRDVCCSVLDVLFSCCGVVLLLLWALLGRLVFFSRSNVGITSTVVPNLAVIPLCLTCWHSASLRLVVTCTLCLPLVDAQTVVSCYFTPSTAATSLDPLVLCPFHVVRYRVIRPCWSIINLKTLFILMHRIIFLATQQSNQLKTLLSCQ